MPRAMNDEIRDNIITMHQAGLNGLAISKILGCSDGTVSIVCNVYDLVEKGEPLPPQLTVRKDVVRWALERHGKDAPKEEPKFETGSYLLDAIATLTKAVEAIDQRLSAMQMTIASARDDANQNTKKLVETINVNGDIQTKEWQSIKDKLEAIKINTKRRPWKENE